jgi:beta-galactosidase
VPASQGYVGGLLDLCLHRLTFSGVKPHSKAKLTLKGLPTKFKSEAWIRVSFRLGDATAWAKKDTEVAFGEHQLCPARSIIQLQASLPDPTGVPSIQEAEPGILAIATPDGSSAWSIDMALGALTSWKKSASPGKELMTEPITIDFYRALTDNDAGGRFGNNWRDRRLHQTKHHVKQIRWEVQRAGLVVHVEGRVGPPVLAWGADTTVKYTFTTHGVCIHARIRPHGLLLPNTFARVGLTLGLKGVEDVRWFGRGPGESYCDKKMAQSMGNWTSPVDGLFFDYEFPQDTGNRTDVRWVEFLGKGEEKGAGESKRLLRARFGDLDGASFSALHYTTKDLDKCLHPYELHARKREDTIVRLDWAHHGLGTGSCGPATLPDYELRTDKVFDFQILLD